MSERGQILPVRDVFIHRMHSNTPDGYRLGIVGDSGGKSGCFGAGVARGILSAEASMRQISGNGRQRIGDVFFGVSASGFNGAYFKAQQKNGSDIYALCDSRYMDTRHMIRRRPPVRNDYLLDLARTGIPLDLEKLRDPSMELKIYATDVQTGKAQEFSDFPDDSIFDILGASAGIPLITGKPRIIDGRSYLDGAASVGRFALKQALAECSHILVTLNARNMDRAKLSKLNWAIACILFPYYPKLAMAVFNQARLTRELMTTLKTIQNDKSSNVRIDYIEPPIDMDPISVQEVRPEVMQKGINAGEQEFYKWIRGSGELPIDRWVNI